MEKDYQPIYAVGEPRELVNAIDELFVANPGYGLVMVRQWLNVIAFLQSLPEDEEYYTSVTGSTWSVQPNRLASKSPRLSVELRRKMTH